MITSLFSIICGVKSSLMLKCIMYPSNTTIADITEGRNYKKKRKKDPYSKKRIILECLSACSAVITEHHFHIRCVNCVFPTASC